MADKRNLKLQLLIDNGYNYMFKHGVYFNPNERKIFSAEAVEDNDIGWLQEKMNSPKSLVYKYYFIHPPCLELKIAIEKNLGCVNA
jgi:hypothetical protein